MCFAASSTTTTSSLLPGAVDNRIPKKVLLLLVHLSDWLSRRLRFFFLVHEKAAMLSMIDLAGSERAATTRNRGLRLKEGANINRSLLALANCINTLSVNGSRSRRRGLLSFICLFIVGARITCCEFTCASLAGRQVEE